MEQATQATTPTAPTSQDDDRASYERATDVVRQLVDQVPTLPLSVRIGRELAPRYDAHIYFGAGLDAGRGVLQTATAIDAEVTRDDQHDGDGNLTSVWIEVRGIAHGVSVYAYGLTNPAEADELLQQTAVGETAEPAEYATEVTQPLPTVGTDPSDVVVPALVAVTPLAAKAAKFAEPEGGR